MLVVTWLSSHLPLLSLLQGPASRDRFACRDRIRDGRAFFASLKARVHQDNIVATNS